jgi:hypothetical protein
MITVPAAEQLTNLERASAAITANLLALENDPNRQMLEIAPLRGRSAEKWGEAKNAIVELWQLSSAFRELLERARAVRGRAPVIAPKRERELAELLRGESAVVPAARLPLAERELVMSARSASRCTPDALLERMRDAFDRIKGVVGAAAHAWDVIAPRLAAMRVTIDEAVAGAGPLDPEGAELVACLDGQLRELGQDVLEDPLAIHDTDVDRVRLCVEALCDELAHAARLRDGIDHEVRAAHGLIDELDTLGAAAQAAHDAVVAKVIAVPTPAPIAGRDERIDAWKRIERLIDGREWHRAGMEIERWRARTADDARRLQSYIENCREPLDRRNQLRGRLDAYRAKAAHWALLEIDDVAAAFDRAHDALYTSPTDLQRAAALVEEYQVVLRDAALVRELDG